MTTALSVMTFSLPILKIVFVLAVLSILSLTVLFILDEIQNYYRDRNRQIWNMQRVTDLVVVTIALFLIAVFYASGAIQAKYLEIRADLQDRRKTAVKARHRAVKEDQARRSFFDDDPFVKGFDKTGDLYYRGAKVPSQARWDYYDKHDKLADTLIFANTKEL
jgi:hypothetical protein